MRSQHALAILTLSVGCVDGQATSPSSATAPLQNRPSPGIASAESWGQTIYAPAYSELRSLGIEERARDVQFACSLSVRNTDIDSAITLNFVDYYDNDGKLVRNYLEAPVELGPLASRDFLVAESDKSGQVGANFLVDWTSETQVSPPYVETVMTALFGGRGFAFSSKAQVVNEAAPKAAE